MSLGRPGPDKAKNPPLGGKQIRSFQKPTGGNKVRHLFYCERYSTNKGHFSIPSDIRFSPSMS